MNRRVRFAAVIGACVLVAAGLAIAACSVTRPAPFPSAETAARAYAAALADGDEQALETIVHRDIADIARQQELASTGGSDPRLVELVPEESEGDSEVWKIGGPPTDESERARSDYLYVLVERVGEEWAVYHAFISHDDSDFLP